MLACRELCLSTLLLRSLITSPPQTDPRFSLCRPLGLPLGFLRFPAISLGCVGKPGGGGICSAVLSFSATLSHCRKYRPEARHPTPEARSPSVGFLAFSAFSLGRVGKPGEGVEASGNSELSTRNSELGTRHSELGTRHSALGTRHSELVYQLATFNVQLSTVFPRATRT
jgi:hypothetical protein